MCLATTFIVTLGLMEEELAIEELCVLGYDVYSDIWEAVTRKS